jgi:hypothetical protein
VPCLRESGPDLPVLPALSSDPRHRGVTESGRMWKIGECGEIAYAAFPACSTFVLAFTLPYKGSLIAVCVHHLAIYLQASIRVGSSFSELLNNGLARSERAQSAESEAGHANMT